MRELISMTLLLVFCAAPMAFGQNVRQNKVRAEIIPSVQSVKPGDQFEIALRFAIDDGWHMYWINPGDSGLPPSVEWKNLPAGVTVGPLRFPIPHRINVGGDLISYGYEGELVLLATVTTTSDLKSPITFDGQLKWLVCKDVCLSERQPASASVQVGETGKPDERFAAWEGKLPTRGEVDASARPKSDREGTLTIKLADDMKSPEFFSADADSVFTNPKLDGASLQIDYKRFDQTKTSATGLLAYTSAKTGQRQAIEFTYKY